MLKHKLVDFIIQFMEEVDKEISEMKLFVCCPMYPPESLSGKRRRTIPYNPTDGQRGLVECQSKICGRVLFDSG